jgi:hypothetical protein
MQALDLVKIEVTAVIINDWLRFRVCAVGRLTFGFGACFLPA